MLSILAIRGAIHGVNEMRSPLLVAMAVTASGAATASAQNLYFGNLGQGANPLAIFTTDLDGLGLTNILTSPSYVSGLDVDGVQKRVFWLDHIGSGRPGDRNAIYSAPLSGGPHTLVASWDTAAGGSSNGRGNNYGMALDTLNQRVYWVDRHGLKRSNYDGSGLAPVAATDGAWSVEVDPAAGKIFWTAPFSSNASRVWMANLDGSNAQALVTLPSEHLSGITVDPVSQTVFWSDFDAGTVSSVPYTGGVPSVILSGHLQAAGLDYEPTTNRLYVVSSWWQTVAWMDPTGGPLTTVFTPTPGVSWGESWDIAVIIPSPGTIALLPGACALLAHRRRRW